jgi:hypothetical protein
VMINVILMLVQILNCHKKKLAEISSVAKLIICLI